MLAIFWPPSRTAFVLVLMSTLFGNPAQAQALTRRGTGMNRANLDSLVSPCTDFYQYANGNWLKNNPVPATESSWGTFNIIAARNAVIQQTIMAGLAHDVVATVPGSNAQKVSDYYATALDTAALEAAGLTYLQPYLARITALRTRPQMQQFLADPRAPTGNAWFALEVGPDEKSSAHYAVLLSQDGLGLPSRDYYLAHDPRAQAIRAAYRTYVVHTFQHLGDAAAPAAAHAEAVLRLETRLAQASKSGEALRDSYANYHKLSLVRAAVQYPNLKLPQLLKKHGLGAAQTIIVGQPSFFQVVSTLLATEPLANQRQYLRWHLVSSAAQALPQAFAEDAFRFNRVLTGAKTPRPRRQYALRATSQALGEAFGQLYVARAFPPAAKARAQQLVENLRRAYAGRIRAAAWLSAATKEEALAKLRALTVKVGYPDHWKDYTALHVNRQSYLQNLLAAHAWARADNLAHFGQPIDLDDWEASPSQILAYYKVAKNLIVFTAGMLQPPLFDPQADDATNYGSLGAVIGHEMTHGFDDQGRKYDHTGSLRDWWTKQDAAQFDARAARLITQFDAFTLLDSLHINGRLTVGENLADLGGLTIAYYAFQQTPQAKEGRLANGFTPNQRFFLAYAQFLATNVRPEAVRQKVLTDPHTPNQFRVIGTLLNMPEFQQAFGCQPTDSMSRPPAEQARIW